MNEKYKRLSLYYRDLWWKSSCDLQLTMTKYTLEEKREHLLAQLKADKIVIVWSELHESIDIKDKKSFLGNL